MRKARLEAILFTAGYVAMFVLMQGFVTLVWTLAAAGSGALLPDTQTQYLLAMASDLLTAGILVLFLRMRRIPLRAHLGLEGAGPMPVAMSLIAGFALSGIAGLFITMLDASGFFTDIMTSYKDQFLALDVRSGLPLYALTIWLLIPVCEEIVFRGLVQNELKRVFRDWQAILIGAALFGIVHMVAVQIAYTFIIGLFFGYAYHKTGKLLVPILMHVLFNVMGTTIGYIGDETAVLALTLAGVPLFFLAWFYFSRSRPAERRPDDRQGGLGT
jgi:membrane protease YdiL (CAAX protease family)